MKKLIFVFTLSLLMVSMAWGQGMEDFTNSTATGTYADNSFLGNDGITWTFGHSRDEGDYPIDGNGLMLRRASDSFLEATIPGGIGNFSFQYRKAFTGASVRQLELYVNDTLIATTDEFGNAGSFEETDVYTLSVDNINVAGNVYVKIKNVGTTTTNRQTVVDNIIWTGYTSSGDPLAATPTFDPTGGDFIDSVTVTLSSTTDDATIYYTLDGNTPDDSSTAYIEDIVLTATTTIKAIAYAPDHDPSTVAEATFTKLEPATTTIPYAEDFSSGWGDIYTYTISGIKPWYISSESATANGYNGSFPEEHWLVLPGIDFTATSAERMSFDTYVQYGDIDADNYLKLFYSADYPGLGAPTGSTWTEIAFDQATSGSVGFTELSAFSGILDISDIDGEQVYLAFKYYAGNNPSSWKVDNISIYIAEPIVTINESLSSFSYIHGEGPSASQSFTVSGADLEGNVTIAAPTNYEISESSESGYTNEITLNHTDGTVAETTIYARLKAGLAIGTYNEDINISTDGAADQTVSLSGEVLLPPPAGYFVDFEGDRETKGSYDSGTVILTGLEWNMTEALIGTLDADWKNGERSARMRGYGNSAMTMLEDKNDGIGQVSFSYRRYGTDSQVDWKVEYSTDQGVSWQQLGDSFTATNSDDVQSFSRPLNISGPARIRIIRATETGSSNMRLNIDDIHLDDFAATNDYPEGSEVSFEGGTITFTQGSANASSVTPPPWNNADLESADAVVLSFELQGYGPWTIEVASDAPYCAYYDAGSWHLAEDSVDSVYTITLAGFGKSGPTVHIVLSDLDPTLPIELSSFTAVLTSTNSALLTWVTETESGVQGYYVLRGTGEILNDATMVSGLIEATNTSQTQTYKFEDSSLFETGTYYYWLQAVDYDGSESYHGPIELLYSQDGGEGGIPEVELVTALKGAFPNPFNPSTSIAYSLAEARNVQFQIFNNRGQLVRSIKVGEKEAGHHAQVWDGVDANGSLVSSGIYYIRMQAGKDSFSSKAVLMK